LRFHILRSAHLGELRLFEPYAPKGRPPLTDVQPLADRLVLFYADYRVPHEVRATHDERLAITIWYFDAVERRGARATDEEAIEQDLLETGAIEKEIVKFEALYGGAAERYQVATCNKT